jgi:hypothetical protein
MSKTCWGVERIDLCCCAACKGVGYLLSGACFTLGAFVNKFFYLYIYIFLALLYLYISLASHS